MKENVTTYALTAEYGIGGLPIGICCRVADGRP